MPSRDLRSPELEAQALTLEEVHQEVPGARLEWATVRNGDVVQTGHVDVPEEYYTRATSQAIWLTTGARETALKEEPHKWANHVAQMLIDDKVISTKDGPHVVALVEVAVRKAIYAQHDLVRAELSGRYPFELRTLIPLIRRSVKTT